MIMASCDAGDAFNLARRLTDALAEVEFGAAGKITISVGISQGPQHAMNPRELVACAEAAMMTSKAHGKNQIVLFDEEATERPEGASVSGRDVRSIAHLKMLQGLAGKLNRLNDVRQIGEVIADELRLLIDYHNCRVMVIEDDEIVPIAFRGDLISRDGERVDFPRTKIGEGITGRAAETAEPQLVANTLECEYAVIIPGTHAIEESLVAVPLNYGTRVIGVVVISKLGVDQFDEDDVRLLEVLAGHASVALENARLYESQRREADHLKALLEFTGAISESSTPEEIGHETVRAASRLLAKRCALWRPDKDGSFRIVAHSNYDESEELSELLDVSLDGAAVRQSDRQADGAVPAQRRGGRDRRAASRRPPLAGAGRGADLERGLRRGVPRRAQPVGAASTRATRSCVCSAASRTRPRSRSSARSASRASRTRSCRPSRRSRTRSRPTTSTPPLTRAGSPTWRSRSAASSASTPPR